MPHLKGEHLCFLGFSLVISLSTLLSLHVGQWAVSVPSLGWVSGVVRIAVFLGVALLSGRIGSLAARPRLVWLAAALDGLGALAVVAWVSAGLGEGLYAAGLVANAVGYALLYLCWVELYARMDLMHVIAYFSLTHLLSAAVSLFVLSVGVPGFQAGCLVALPFACAALYGLSRRRAEEAPFMQGEETSGGWSVPWKPIVLLGTFTFANSFVRHFLNVELKGAVLLGVVLGAAFVLALLARRRERLDLRAIYATSLPLIVAASLCVLVALPGFGVAGALLSNAAYTLFSIFTTVLLCNVCFRYGVGPLWLFGFACASISLGSLATSALTARVDFIEASQPLLALSVSALVMVFVCLYVAFGSSGEDAAAWGLTREALGQGADGADGGPCTEAVEQRCARLARRFGLTRREEEVMALLAQDATYAQVEDSLAIANSTLKTHVRHIYAKLGVADKRELAELVAGE